VIEKGRGASRVQNPVWITGLATLPAGCRSAAASTPRDVWWSDGQRNDAGAYQQAATPSGTLEGIPEGRGAAPTNTPQDCPPGMASDAFHPVDPGGAPAAVITSAVLPGLGENRNVAESAMAA
jgi:hypothetical protein